MWKSQVQFHFRTLSSALHRSSHFAVLQQNLGAILRSVHYLGATGVLTCSRNSAPLTPTVSKASSGALEFLTVHSCHAMQKTLANAAREGWRVLGTPLCTSLLSTKTWAGVKHDVKFDVFFSLSCSVLLSSCDFWYTPGMYNPFPFPYNWVCPSFCLKVLVTRGCPDPISGLKPVLPFIFLAPPPHPPLAGALFPTCRCSLTKFGYPRAKCRKVGAIGPKL
jgi:hypothetical protein